MISGLLSAGIVPVAGATVPELLTRAPEGELSGSGAGQIGYDLGVAADPSLPGDVYVLDNNYRVDEFSPWGEFIQAFGWGVRDGGEKLESCTQASGCQKGLAGDGSGEIHEATGIAVDAGGRLYVLEAITNHRVQVFDSEGKFLFMFGDEVNKTALAEGRTAEAGVCPAAGHPADECQAGGAGTDPGQLQEAPGPDSEQTGRIAVSPVDGTIFIGEPERIQEFNPDGSYRESIALPEGKTAGQIAVDGAGNLYMHLYAYTPRYPFRALDDKTVVKMSPRGPTATFLTPSFPVEHPEAGGEGEETPSDVAVDAEGNVFVPVITYNFVPQKVLAFDDTGTCTDCGTSGEGGGSGFASPGSLNYKTHLVSVATGSACGAADVYVAAFAQGHGPELSYVDFFGLPPDPALCPPPARPPVISAEFALAVGADSAEVGAQINPRFWNDTTYYLEYGPGVCSEGGCVARPTAPGVTLSSRVANVPLASGRIALGGLAGDTTYHYRFVVQSGGGGPVYGPEQTFTTYRSGAEVSSCAGNEAFRVGASALLPDCRAFEMVSPVDKEGGDVLALREAYSGVRTALAQSAASGSKFAYGSYRSFGDAESAPWTSQYVAARTAQGWVSHGVSSPRGALIPGAAGLDTEARAFSPDLCQEWMVSSSEPPLTARAVVGNPNIYRRLDGECGTSTEYESLTTLEPPYPYSEARLEGVSEDGSDAVYAVQDNLTVDAPGLEGKGMALYYQAAGEGPSRYVCILPDGKPIATACIAGVENGAYPAYTASLQHAVSTDASRVYWTAYRGSGGAGQIYLRENPGAEQSALAGGACIDPEAACTVAVSQQAEEASGTTESKYWTAAADGSRALFTTTRPGGGVTDLYRFELAEDKDRLIAHQAVGVLGASEDCSYVYFASAEALGGPNAQGQSAVEDERNLYVYHEGQVRFIGVLPAQEVYPSPISGVALDHDARVSANGLYAVFATSARMTDYDSTDARSGEADYEVYRYDAAATDGEGKLTCISCNPTGERPTGGQEPVGNDRFWGAGWIPAWETSLYASRALTDDGSRVFFEAFDALVPRDTNGTVDVYEWEAPGDGSCTEAAVAYSVRDEGCIFLISSGQSARPSEFVDASPSGSDVFVATLSSLVPQDTGLIDIYDARVDGGFAMQQSERALCEGEACQPAPTPPLGISPGSLSFSGPGNAKLAEPSAHTPRRTKKQKLERRLKRALKRCHERGKRKRATCERRARKRHHTARGGERMSHRKKARSQRSKR